MVSFGRFIGIRIYKNDIRPQNFEFWGRIRLLDRLFIAL